jgi:hypothetical protein
MTTSWDSEAAAAAAQSHRSAAGETRKIADHFDTLPAELAKLGPIAAPLQQAVAELVATRKAKYNELGISHEDHATALTQSSADFDNTDSLNGKGVKKDDE